MGEMKSWHDRITPVRNITRKHKSATSQRRNDASSRAMGNTCGESYNWKCYLDADNYTGIPNSSTFKLSIKGQSPAEASKQVTKTKNSQFWKSYFRKTKSSVRSSKNKKSTIGRMPHSNDLFSVFAF